MPTAELKWSQVHPAALRQVAAFVRATPATRLKTGALRYTCPTNGSFVLLTDEAALRNATAGRPVLCPSCGERHEIDAASAV